MAQTDFFHGMKAFWQASADFSASGPETKAMRS